MATQLPKISNLTDDIIRAQKAWSKGVVAIGKVSKKRKKYKRVANKMLDQLYDFNTDGSFILFKPTLAYKKPIRVNRKQTACYFIGCTSGDRSDGNGFALRPWKDVRFKHDFYFTQLASGDVLVMGQCEFYENKDSETPTVTADYTFGYRRDSMRIFLHHSSRTVGEEDQKECLAKGKGI